MKLLVVLCLCLFSISEVAKAAQANTRAIRTTASEEAGESVIYGFPSETRFVLSDYTTDPSDTKGKFTVVGFKMMAPCDIAVQEEGTAIVDGERPTQKILTVNAVTTKKPCEKRLESITVRLSRPVELNAWISGREAVAVKAPAGVVALIIKK